LRAAINSAIGEFFRRFITFFREVVVCDITFFIIVFVEMESELEMIHQYSIDHIRCIDS